MKYTKADQITPPPYSLPLCINPNSISISLSLPIFVSISTLCHARRRTKPTHSHILQSSKNVLRDRKTDDDDDDDDNDGMMTYDVSQDGKVSEGEE